MANRKLILFLFIAFGVLVIAACLFLGLWKFGIGEWAFLAGVICAIAGTAAFLYAVAQIEGRKTKIENRRISFLLYTWLSFAAATILFFGLWKTGVGEWASTASMVFSAFFVLAPSFWFIIQPDLAITTFNAITWDVNAPNDWERLSPIRRAIVYLGTVMCLAIGIMILIYVFSRLLSG